MPYENLIAFILSIICSSLSNWKRETNNTKFVMVRRFRAFTIFFFKEEHFISFLDKNNV